MEITTNNVPREMIPFQCLPKKVQEQVVENYENAPEFEWVKYKGWWYCLEDFMIADSVKGWDGIAHDSYFSGVLVRLVDGGERIVFGRYYC